MKTKTIISAALVTLALGCTPALAQDSTPANRLVIHADQGKQTISRNIYGHFAEHLGRCIYEGIWVGEDSPIPNTRGIRNDVVAALKQIKVPVLRWPGGCVADEYHWKDGIGPRAKRPAMAEFLSRGSRGSRGSRCLFCAEFNFPSRLGAGRFSA